MNRIYLVRHGENQANITKEFSYKKVDYPLTPKGVLQAQQTAEYFRDKNIHEIYASPLKRAQQTAEIIASTLDLPVVIMENFREVNVGSLEDQPPKAEHWNLFLRIFGDWFDGRHDTSFPGGEDYDTLSRRMRTGMEQIVAGKSGRNIVIVGHGGIFTIALKDLCRNADLNQLRRTPNHNCSVTELAVDFRDGLLLGELTAYATFAHLHGEAAELVLGVPRRREMDEGIEVAMQIDWDDMHDKVTRTLQELIRFDTTNPPGNETLCAEYIQGRLAGEGIEATLLESAPGRGNVVARIRGNGSGRPLLLMSHIDVVPAEVERWTYPPFAAEIHDGYLWGRGALDTKCLTAVQLEVILLLKRLRVPLKRDVILAATADEEAGGIYGMGWLVENHSGLIEAEYAINEGGGAGLQMGDRRLFLCQTAEKGGCPTRLRANGKAGHASRPTDDMAVAKLVTALDRLVHARLPYHLVSTVEATIHAFSQAMPSPMNEAILGLLDPEQEPLLLESMTDAGFATLIRASLHNTATPTILRAGTKTNVIPSVAEAILDCRVLPGQQAEDLTAELRSVLGDEVEIEVMRGSSGTESAYQTPFFEVITQVMAEIEPGSLVVPYMLPAVTDAPKVARKGTEVYGFFPTKSIPGETPGFELTHGHNERISLDNLLFATRALWEIVHRLCAV